MAETDRGRLSLQKSIELESAEYAELVQLLEHCIQPEFDHLEKFTKTPISLWDPTFVYVHGLFRVQDYVNQLNASKLKTWVKSRTNRLERNLKFPNKLTAEGTIGHLTEALDDLCEIVSYRVHHACVKMEQRRLRSKILVTLEQQIEPADKMAAIEKALKQQDENIVRRVLGLDKGDAMGKLFLELYSDDTDSLAFYMKEENRQEVLLRNQEVVDISLLAMGAISELTGYACPPRTFVDADDFDFQQKEHFKWVLDSMEITLNGLGDALGRIEGRLGPLNNMIKEFPDLRSFLEAAKDPARLEYLRQSFFVAGPDKHDPEDFEEFLNEVNQMRIAIDVLISLVMVLWSSPSARRVSRGTFSILTIWGESVLKRLKDKIKEGAQSLQHYFYRALIFAVETVLFLISTAISLFIPLLLVYVLHVLGFDIANILTDLLYTLFAAVTGASFMQQGATGLIQQAGTMGTLVVASQLPFKELWTRATRSSASKVTYGLLAGGGFLIWRLKDRYTKATADSNTRFSLEAGRVFERVKSMTTVDYATSLGFTWLYNNRLAVYLVTNKVLNSLGLSEFLVNTLGLGPAWGVFVLLSLAANSIIKSYDSDKIIRLKTMLLALQDPVRAAKKENVLPGTDILETRPVSHGVIQDVVNAFLQVLYRGIIHPGKVVLGLEDPKNENAVLKEVIGTVIEFMRSDDFLRPPDPDAKGWRRFRMLVLKGMALVADLSAFNMACAGLNVLCSSVMSQMFDAWGYTAVLPICSYYFTETLIKRLLVDLNPGNLLTKNYPGYITAIITGVTAVYDKLPEMGLATQQVRRIREAIKDVGEQKNFINLTQDQMALNQQQQQKEPDKMLPNYEDTAGKTKYTDSLTSLIPKMLRDANQQKAVTDQNIIGIIMGNSYENQDLLRWRQTVVELEGFVTAARAYDLTLISLGGSGIDPNQFNPASYSIKTIGFLHTLSVTNASNEVKVINPHAYILIEPKKDFKGNGNGMYLKHLFWIFDAKFLLNFLSTVLNHYTNSFHSTGQLEDRVAKNAFQKLLELEQTISSSNKEAWGLLSNMLTEWFACETLERLIANIAGESKVILNNRSVASETALSQFNTKIRPKPGPSKTMLINSHPLMLFNLF